MSAYQEIATDLCLPTGLLNGQAKGWSAEPHLRLNLPRALFRRKRWNFWTFTSERYVFCATIADLDYVAACFVYLFDFETGQCLEAQVENPLAIGLKMSNHLKADAIFKNKKINMAITHTADQTKLLVQVASFAGKPLTANFVIDQSGHHETLNVVIPWNDRQFQFTSKQNAWPTYGTVIHGQQVIAFEAGQSLAQLDFGRGIWPYQSFWNWACANGKVRGHSFGLNLGAGWTDGTGANENAVLYGGKIHKIFEDVRFDYDKADLMKPWEITTKDSQRLSLQFTPVGQRGHKTNFGIVASDMKQAFGHFSGSFRLDDGEVLNISGIPGWIEDHFARW